MKLYRVLESIIAFLIVASIAWATGSLTIPNNIFTTPNNVASSKMDENWAAIATYVNTRQITFDVLSNRPVPGTAGRYYFGTDTVTLYADNGTSWTALGPPVTGQLVSQRASLTLANNGTSTQTFLVFPGAASSDDSTISNRVLITLSSTLTKKLTSWTVGSGNGCLDTGAAAAFTFYHVFIITRIDTGVVDVLCSTSATSPTMPSNYTKKQRLGAIRTTWHATAGNEIYFFSQVKNRFRWATLTSTVDVSATPAAATPVVATLSVPNGVVAKALVICTTNVGRLYLSELNAAASAAGNNVHSCASFGAHGGNQASVMTDTAQRIRYENESNVASVIVTYGWEEMWD